jgi:CelD/BcsL family acetyltransferase involved in cellulose biosynthesis
MNFFVRQGGLIELGVEAGTPARAGRFQVELWHDLAAVAPIWRDLQGESAIGGPYQKFEWVVAWQEHVGNAQGTEPCVLIGRDRAGTAAFLLPLGRKFVGPLGVASFLGGKHSNANLGLWRRDVAGSVTAADLHDILDQVRRLGSGIDLLVLVDQPTIWGELANPLASLSVQTSPSAGYRGALDRDFATLFRTRVDAEARRKLRKKERRLAAHGAVRYWRPSTAAQAQHILQVFFAQKAQRMEELGLKDVFTSRDVRAFIAAAATSFGDGTAPPIELYAASVGDVVVATMGGVVSGGRFSAMFNSIIRTDLARESPGQLLLVNVVRMCCERGLTTFDLGIGDARYKHMFCDEPEPLFDSVLGLTPLGRAAAPLWRLHLSAKTRIKRSRLLWAAARKFRRHYADAVRMIA